MLSVKKGNCEYQLNFQVIALTRLGIKPESTAPETDALTNGLFELFDNETENKIKQDQVIIV